MSRDPPVSSGEDGEDRPASVDHDPAAVDGEPVEEIDDDATTESTRTRWEGTGTALALLSVGTPWALAAWFTVDGGSVPLWLTATVTVEAFAATAWTFGSGAMRAATDALGK